MQIFKKFKRLRPPGHYVDSRMIHSRLPKKLKKKTSRRLVLRRLAAKGFRPEEKQCKDDPSEQLKKRRLDFARKHAGKNFQQWQSHLQGVADLSDT